MEGEREKREGNGRRGEREGKGERRESDVKGNQVKKIERVGKEIMLEATLHTLTNLKFRFNSQQRSTTVNNSQQQSTTVNNSQ